MELCHHKGKFLYEARPDILPQGFLTSLEVDLWNDFLTEKKRG